MKNIISSLFYFRRISFFTGLAAVLLLLAAPSVSRADHENVRLSLVSISGMTVTVMVQCDPASTSCDEYNTSSYIMWSEDDYLNHTNGTLVSTTGVFSHTYTTAGSYCIGLLCGGGEGACGYTVLGSDGCWTGGSCATAQWCLNVTVPDGGVDTQDPTVTIQEPTTNTTYVATTPILVVSGQATDNVEATQISWANNRGGGGTAIISSTFPSGGLTYSLWSAIGIPLQTGENILTITAEDAAGNSGTDVITVTYTPPDTVPPSITITTPTTADTFTLLGSGIALRGIASDNSGSVLRVDWSNDRGGSGTAVGTMTWRVDSIWLYEGVNVVTVTAYDAAGNSSTDVLTVTRVLAPTDMFVLSSITGTYHNTVNVVVTCNPDNPCDGYGNDLYVAWTGPPWVLGSNLSGPITTESNELPFGKNFSHSYYGGGTYCLGLVSYRNGVLTPLSGCWFAGGNTCSVGETCEQVVIYGGDTVGPNVSVLSPQSPYETLAGMVAITGTVMDVAQPYTGIGSILRSGDGVDRVEWVNGGVSGTATLTLQTRWEGNWIANVPLNPGYNYIRITGYDYAGNASSIVQRTVNATVVDTLSPTVTISSPTSAATYTTTTPVLTLGGMATDNVGVSQVSWSNDRGGSGTASGTSAWTAAGITLQTGTNVITITAQDAAGNSGTDILTVTYSPPDTVPPTVTITNPTSATSYATTALTLAMGGMATDNMAVSQVSWLNNRGGSGTAIGTTAWNITSIPLQPGSNLITVTARDTAGNNATDTLTVTCTPLAGAYSVTPSPALSNVVPGQNNIIPLSYLATAIGGGSFTVTSTSGSFIGGNSGRILGTVNSSIAIDIRNGSGMENETLTVAPKIMTAAVDGGESRIIYRRTFSDGVNTVVSEVTLQVVPISAGPFSFTRLALRFDGAPSPGRITIERNTLCPTVFADLSYRGSGFLRGQWLVDGQILGFVNQQLLPGTEKLTLESPKVPPFPTYDTGRHEVTFEIIDPEPGFTEPVIHYYVIEGEGGGVIDSFRLLSPAEGASVAMAMGGPYPEFSCQTLAGNLSYHFELFPAGLRAEQIPLVKAISKSGTYQLSQMDVQRLSRNLPYRWQVKVYDLDRLVAASVFRNIYFIAPAGDGEIELRNLQIVPMPTQGFLHWLLTPNSAFAADPPPADATTTFSVTAGETVLMSSDLVNDTAISKSHLRVEFIVDGEVVDASFVQMLLPGETITVEGAYEVPDAKSHSLEVRVVAGEETEPLSTIVGTLVGEAPEETVTKGGSVGGNITIGAFTIEVSDINDTDPGNVSGSGTVTLPFLNETLNVSFTDLSLDAQRAVESGTIQITPASPLEYELAPADISLDSLTLAPAPGGATCQGHLAIDMPFSNDPLEMTFTDAGIHPDDGLSGTITLAQAFHVDLPGLDGFAITLNAGSNVTLGPAFDSSLLGSVKLPDDVLALASSAGLEFSQLAFNSDGGFSGSVTLDNTNIAGTNFGINGALSLDFTKTESPGEKSADPDWMGVYLTSGKLTLPTNPLKISEISITDLYVDNGLNCDVSIENLSQTFSVGSDPTKFSGTLSGIKLNCANHRSGNSNFSGSLIGKMTIPYLDAEIATVIGISAGDLVLSISLTEDQEISLAGGDVTLTIGSDSTIQFVNNVLRAELVTTFNALGDLLGSGTEAGLTATLLIASDGEIGIVDTSLSVQKWIGFEQNHNVDFMGVFSLGISEVGFGLDDDQLFFGIGGELNIVEDKLNGSARVGIYLPSGGIWTNDISVEFGTEETFYLDGTVSWLDGEEWGSGFSGEMDLLVANVFSVSSRLIAGYKDRTGSESGYPYFYIEGYASGFPPIPLTPYPLSFYSFGGGAYFNIAPVVDGQGTPVVNEEGKYQYTPENGSYGVKALVGLGTTFDEGYTFNGTLGLELNLQSTSFSVMMKGEAYVLCERASPNDNRKITANATLNWSDSGDCAFTSQMKINDFAIVEPGSALVSITGEIDLKLATNDWYLYMGRKDDPGTVAILPDFVEGGIGTAKGYFEVDKLGIRTGYLVEIDSGRRHLLIFYGRVWGGQSADFEASFDPMFVYAEFSYWLGLEAGVGIDGLGNFEIFSAQALLNGGVRTPNPTMIWVRGEVSYSLLGGIVSGDWGMRFVWPEDADQATIQQATWDCFDSFVPEDATKDFNIWRPIKGVMTTPVGRKITFQDADGEDLDIKVTLREEDVNLYCTTCVGPVVDRPPMPGKVLWNNSKIAFTFEPDYFLEPNQTYVFEAKATAEGSLLINESYIDATTFTFTTGDFPSSIDLLVKDSYPKTGRRFCYTGYPIQVELNRSLPALDNNNVEAHLVTEDGTEVPGVYTLADDYRSLQFVPDAYLSQNTFYEFKLVNPLMSGMTKSAPSETTAETPKMEEIQAPKEEILGHMHTVDPEDQYLAQLVEGLGETWLSIKFETGAYHSFKAMLEASDLKTFVTRPRVYTADDLETLQNAPSYSVRFSAIESFYWNELDLEVVAKNEEPAGCTTDCSRSFAMVDRQSARDLISASWGLDSSLGHFDLDCNSTVSGLRDITRSASESIAPQFTSAESVRQGLNLEVRYQPLRVVSEISDCDFDIWSWNNDLNDSDHTGSYDASPACVACLNDQLVEGSQIKLAHRYSNVISEKRWFIIDVELPDLPTEPDDPPDDGGLPELVDTRPQEFEVDGDTFIGPGEMKPDFQEDVFGTVGDIIDDIPWKLDDFNPVNDFNELVAGYEELVSDFDNMNFGTDLIKQYDTLTQQYDTLIDQYNDLLQGAANVKGVSDYLVNGMQSLNRSFQDLNGSFMDLNSGIDIF